MRRLFYIPLLFCFYDLSGQQLSKSDLIGTWSTNNFKYTKWIIQENTLVEFGVKLIKGGFPVDFFYYFDSAENELRISQTYGEGYDTTFLFKINYHDQNSITLNYYKKITYSRTTEKPQKEIIIPNGGITIILRRKIPYQAGQNKGR